MTTNQSRLPLINELKEGRALWYGNVTNLVDQSIGEGEVRILGLGLQKQPLDLFNWHLRLVWRSAERVCHPSNVPTKSPKRDI